MLELGICGNIRYDFSFLDDEDPNRAGLVCKQWNDARRRKFVAIAIRSQDQMDSIDWWRYPNIGRMHVLLDPRSSPSIKKTVPGEQINELKFTSRRFLDDNELVDFEHLCLS